MTIHRISPEEAHALLAQGYAYVDVRSVEEFQQGHPEGAFNVPWQFLGGLDNPDFLSTFRRHFAPDSKFILGCRSGNRSLSAARRLEQAGYGEIHELKAGYAGKSDPFGRVVEPGWHGAGLPCAMDAQPGRDYRALSADED